MRVFLSFFAATLIGISISGCMSSNSEGTPPNYVESQLTNNPLPSSARLGNDVLPPRVGGLQ
jgi:hypothetical protein